MPGPKHGLSRLDRMVGSPGPSNKDPRAFGRIGPLNPIKGNGPNGKPFTPKSMVEALSAVVDTMQGPEPSKNRTVAGGMTFFGQMVDHDITLDASSAIGSKIDPAQVRNIRTPSLDLDCIYGNGPEASPWLYHPKHKGFLLFGTKKNPRDLARNAHGTALIGDPRNDENIILSQLQGVFITFHNIVLSNMIKKPKMVADTMASISAYGAREVEMDGDEPFEAAREVCRRHFHWLVEHDLLSSFVDSDVMKGIYEQLKTKTLPTPFSNDSPLIPIEFSAAAYRFGHATANSGYFVNKHKSLKLFEFGGFGPKDDPNFNIDFRFMFWGPTATTTITARPIGRTMTEALFELPKAVVGGGIMFGNVKIKRKDAAKLPLRNLLRDRLTFQLASGEQMATLIGTSPLPLAKELSDQCLTQSPLWYYCLNEAEKHKGKLGPVGGTIVATTLLRLLDPSLERYVDGAPKTDVKKLLGATKRNQKYDYSVGHLFEYVDTHRNDIKVAADLICG